MVKQFLNVSLAEAVAEQCSHFLLLATACNGQRNKKDITKKGVLQTFYRSFTSFLLLKFSGTTDAGYLYFIASPKKI
jgi:hypothetical protein